MSTTSELILKPKLPNCMVNMELYIKSNVVLFVRHMHLVDSQHKLNVCDQIVNYYGSGDPHLYIKHAGNSCYFHLNVVWHLPLAFFSNNVVSASQRHDELYCYWHFEGVILDMLKSDQLELIKALIVKVLEAIMLATSTNLNSVDAKLLNSDCSLLMSRVPNISGFLSIHNKIAIQDEMWIYPHVYNMLNDWKCT